MQIVLKENEKGFLCLFDTRSGLFFEGGSVKNEQSGESILRIANDIAKKPTKVIIEIADSGVYSEYGYLDTMLAKKYLAMNSDLRESNTEDVKLKQNKKTQIGTGGKRGRPRKK